MKLSRRQLFVTGASVAAATAGASIWASKRPPADNSAIGHQAPGFSVADTMGKVRTLAEFSGQLVALEWTSPSCPFVGAQYASGGMQASHRWAADRGVIWLSVLSTHPSRPDYLDATKAAAFNKERGASPTALLLDANGAMGRAYGARTTPHMFVISTDGKLAYAGAIDDRPSFFKAQVAGAHNHVRAAIDDLMAGRAVGTASTQPYGCAVGYEG